MLRRFFPFLLFIGVPAIVAQSTPEALPTPKGEIVYGKALYLPKPPYPPEARAGRIVGQVRVAVNISATGNVTSATAVAGPEELRRVSEHAAMNAKFSPTTASGATIATTGSVTFSFTLPFQWENVGKMIGNLELGKLVNADYSRSEKEIIRDVGKDAKSELFAMLKSADRGIDERRVARLAVFLYDRLKERLPTEAWYFELGRTHGRMYEFSSKPERGDQFVHELEKIGLLLETAPSGIPPYRLDALVRIETMYPVSSELTFAQKHEILDLLFDSFNLAPAGTNIR